MLRGATDFVSVPFSRRFKPEDETFQFTLSFARPKVEKDELIQALRGILERLLSEQDTSEAARVPGESSASASAGLS